MLAILTQPRVKHNALKRLAGIDHSIKLLSPAVLTPIQTLKVDHLGSRNPRLHTDEVLIALAITAVGNPDAARAMRISSGIPQKP